MRKQLIINIGISLCIAAFVSVHSPLVYAQVDEAAIQAREAALRAELDAVLKEIEAQRAVLGAEQAKGASLQRDVNILTAQINQAKLKIRAKEIAIATLGKDITSKTDRIEDLSTRVEKNQESLRQLVRRTNQINDFTLAEVVLSNQNLSDFFKDYDSYHFLKQSLNVTLENIKENKKETEVEREQLGQKRAKEVDEKVSIEVEKKKIDQATAEKNRLLNLSKQEQASYRSVIASREARAAQIRTALFSLRDAQAIPFEKALEYANAASKLTGVRAAFILGILKQESNLGKNVGQCLLVDARTGAGKGKNTGTPFANLMKPDRDVAPFLEITQKLGRDPYNTPVSCPLGYGYGGAMGPSQFIASTWRSYEGRLSQLLGTTADPWIPEHAFMATGLFLADLGASRGGHSAETEAAARYYAGGGWATRGMGYASSVLSHAATFQENINFLNNGM